MVELAIGCKVMVMTNINTDLEIANGAQGEVVQIWTDPQEECRDSTASVQNLKYPPSCVLVRMDRFRLGQIQGLEGSTIPLFPVLKMIEYITANGVKHKLQCWQVTLDGAYTFTNYQAQGQTIDYLLADIGTPLKGWLTPFNAYVTLSRAHRQNYICLI